MKKENYYLRNCLRIAFVLVLGVLAFRWVIFAPVYELEAQNYWTDNWKVVGSVGYAGENTLYDQKTCKEVTKRIHSVCLSSIGENTLMGALGSCLPTMYCTGLVDNSGDYKDNCYRYYKTKRGKYK